MPIFWETRSAFSGLESIDALEYRMRPFFCVTLIFPVLALVSGCTTHDPLPEEPPTTAITEEEIRNIAEEVAQEVAEREIARNQLQAERRAKEEQEQRKKATEEETRLARQRDAAAEEQAIIDAVESSEEAYWLLVPSERMRADAIREQISKVGLTKLDHKDVQWAWQGDGQDCLRAELLAAARKAQEELEADTASLNLTDSALVEFFCLEPLEQLQRLHLAKRLVAQDPTIDEEIIVEFRHDPFLRRLIAAYMKAQNKRPR